MNKLLYYLKICFLLIVLIKTTGCSEKQPVTPESNAGIKLYVLWDSTGHTSQPVRLNNAKVFLSSEYGTEIRYTNEEGILEADNLPSAVYSFSVISNFPGDNNIILSGNVNSVTVRSGDKYCDTIYVKPYSSGGIVINELYLVGPINNTYFCWDQYIELYNSSDSVKYLDGCQIARMESFGTSGAGADPDNDGDIEKVSHIYKFPGNPGEKNIPFQPRSFLVIAADAINHSTDSQNALDLSNADWEFYNQYSPDDIDNPKVPNLINLQPERVKDFHFVLNVGVIILTNGRDTNWEDGVDINTILDGIEYENQSNGKKTLDSRVDRGHVFSPALYSGNSLQRREPGLDSGNSLLDWIINDHPTPGYQ